MDWSKQKVLVTGGGGFVGSHLVEKLVGLGATTRALVHYNSLGSWGWLDASALKNDVEVVAGDVRDRSSVEDAVKGVDVVFHLAALIAIPYSYRAPLSYVHTNVEGTLNVLQASLSAGVRRVVHTSTSEVYGTACRVPMDEEHPLQGQSPYSASKIGADKMAEAFWRSFQAPVVTVRPFNTYGPRQSARAVIPTIISQALTQPRIALGSLLPTRDFNFVEDTVAGFVCAAQTDGVEGQVINLGTGKEISVGDVAARILKQLGKELPLESQDARLRPANSEVERLCAGAGKAKRLLGWEPGHTLDQGLAKTIAWVKENSDRFRPQTYTV